MSQFFVAHERWSSIDQRCWYIIFILFLTLFLQGFCICMYIRLDINNNNNNRWHEWPYVQTSTHALNTVISTLRSVIKIFRQLVFRVLKIKLLLWTIWFLQPFKIWCFVKFENSSKFVKALMFDRILHEIYIIKSKMFFGH